MLSVGMMLFMVSAASASPVVLIELRWHPNEPSVLNRTGCDFIEDAMILVVTDDGKELVHEDFCSSYGKAAAKVASDKRGRTYVLLDYSEGRGTNATTEYLSVYRLTPNLPAVMRIPISWAVGMTQRFVYEYEAKPDESGGLLIVLRGKAETGSECCLPPEKLETIHIDPGE